MNRAKLNAAYGKARARLAKLKMRLREDREDVARFVRTLEGAKLYDKRSAFPAELVAELFARGQHDVLNGVLASYCYRSAIEIDVRSCVRNMMTEVAFDRWMSRCEAELET